VITIGDLLVNLVVGDGTFQGDVEKQAEKAGDSASKTFGSRFKQAGKVVGTALVAGSLALTVASVGGIAAAKEWESSFAGVKKTLDVTGLSTEQQNAAFAQMEKELRSLGRQMPVNVNTLAALAEAAGALGIARDDVVEFTKQTAILGETTDVAAEDAATAFGKINAVMPISRDQYARMAATIVDLGNKGASTESEIIHMAERLAGTASSVRMSHAAMLGWSSAMSSVAIEAEAGASSFQKVAFKVVDLTATGTRIQTWAEDAGLSVEGFLDIVAEGGKPLEQLAFDLGMTSKELRKLVEKKDKLQELAETAGMTAEAFQDLWSKDSSEALRRFVNGYSKLNESQRLFLRQSLEMDDIRVSDFLNKLAGDTTKVNDALSLAPQAWGDATAATDEYGKRLATTDSKIALAEAAINDAAITLGQNLLPAVASVATSLADLVNGVNDWMQANPELMATITPIAAALAGLIALNFGTKFLGSLLPLGSAGGIITRAFAPLGRKMGEVLVKNIIPAIASGLAVETAVDGIATPGVLANFKRLGSRIGTKGLGLGLIAGIGAAMLLNDVLKTDKPVEFEDGSVSDFGLMGMDIQMAAGAARQRIAELREELQLTDEEIEQLARNAAVHAGQFGTSIDEGVAVAIAGLDDLRKVGSDAGTDTATGVSEGFFDGLTEKLGSGGRFVADLLARIVRAANARLVGEGLAETAASWYTGDQSSVRQQQEEMIQGWLKDRGSIGALLPGAWTAKPAMDATKMVPYADYRAFFGLDQLAPRSRQDQAKAAGAYVQGLAAELGDKLRTEKVPYSEYRAFLHLDQLPPSATKPIADALAAPFEDTQRRLRREQQEALWQAAWDIGAGLPRAISDGARKDSNVLTQGMAELRDIIKNGITPKKLALQATTKAWFRELSRGIRSNKIGAREAAQDLATEGLVALSDAGIKGKKGANAIGRNLGQLYASGLSRSEIEARLAAQGVNLTALEKIAAKQGWHLAGEGPGAKWVQGLTSQEKEARREARKLNRLVRDVLAGKIGWHEAGWKVIKAWIDGVTDHLKGPGRTAIQSVLGSAIGGILKGNSPPPEGPLADIDKGGWNVGAAWADSVAAAIGASRGDIEASADSLLDHLAPVSTAWSSMGRADVALDTTRHVEATVIHRLSAEAAQSLRGAGFDDRAVAGFLLASPDQVRREFEDVY